MQPCQHCSVSVREGLLLKVDDLFGDSDERDHENRRAVSSPLSLLAEVFALVSVRVLLSNVLNKFVVYVRMLHNLIIAMCHNEIFMKTGSESLSTLKQKL